MKAITASAGLLLTAAIGLLGHPVSASEAPKRISASSLTTRDGIRLSYQDLGVGEPVVFVHGWILGADVWEYQTAFISRNGFRAIAYDQRGCGDSEKPNRGYDLESGAQDLNDVLEALDLNNVSIVAHSLGAAQAVRYLGKYGRSRVKRLVLVGAITPGGNPEPIQKRIFESMTRPMQQDRAAFLAGALPQGFFAPGGAAGPASPELIRWTTGLSMRCSLHASIESARAVAYADVREDLPKIDIPTTVIHGARDLSAPITVTGARTVAAIPGSKLITYEGTGHALLLTEKDRLNADLLAILSK